MSIDVYTLSELREVLQKEMKAKEFYLQNLPRFSDAWLREKITHSISDEEKHEKKAKEMLAQIKKPE